MAERLSTAERRPAPPIPTGRGTRARAVHGNRAFPGPGKALKIGWRSRARHGWGKMPVLIDATELTRLIADIFTRAGCSEAEAERIGRYLVSANLVGHDSPGVVRVPRYVQQLRGGSVLADRPVDIVRATPGMARLHGTTGLGP